MTTHQTLHTRKKVWFAFNFMMQSLQNCIYGTKVVRLSFFYFYLMVRSQVVNLSPEHLCPKVFADELHYVQLIFEAGRVSSHPGGGGAAKVD